MEKLKAKHDHALTDILKVLIFILFLLIPGIMFLPSMLYFGFNEQANAPVKEVTITENIKLEHFNQLIVPNFQTTRNNYYFTITKTNTTTEWVNQGNFNFNLTIGHKYYLKIANATSTNSLSSSYWLIGGNGPIIKPNTYPTGNVVTLNNNRDGNIGLVMTNDVPQGTVYTGYLNLIDLTQIYGEGNEPTLQQAESTFNNNYYNFGLDYSIYIEDYTTTEQVVDITTQLEWNWEQIWERPILSWTKYSILKQGLDAFTEVFGVTQTSYITNLIAYELIMVAIYIVIDIVISIFKWLTHLIGTK